MKSADKYYSKTGKDASGKPAAMFANHALAFANGTYYDPSYGRTYSDLQKFESAALDGFWREIQEQGLGGNSFYRALFRKKGTTFGIMNGPGSEDY